MISGVGFCGGGGKWLGGCRLGGVVGAGMRWESVVRWGVEDIGERCGVWWFRALLDGVVGRRKCGGGVELYLWQRVGGVEAGRRGTSTVNFGGIDGLEVYRNNGIRGESDLWASTMIQSIFLYFVYVCLWLNLLPM